MFRTAHASYSQHLTATEGNEGLSTNTSQTIGHYTKELARHAIMHKLHNDAWEASTLLRKECYSNLTN